MSSKKVLVAMYKIVSEKSRIRDTANDRGAQEQTITFSIAPMYTSGDEEDMSVRGVPVPDPDTGSYIINHGVVLDDMSNSCGLFCWVHYYPQSRQGIVVVYRYEPLESSDKTGFRYADLYE